MTSARAQFGDRRQVDVAHLGPLRAQLRGGTTSMPWLGLIALMIAAVTAVAVLGALAWAMVAAPLAVGRAIGHRWHGRSAAP